ncbi:MAG: transglutaminase domain-containing protein [Dehalococcoidia bacterium]|nr:MAG: transglutaminase domain-containing protein [Dehalococcoidia bacterium]
MKKTLILVMGLLMLVFIGGCTDDSTTQKPGIISAAPATQPAAQSADSENIKVEVTPMQSVAAAFYLQMPNLDITFIDFDITNNGSSNVKVLVESEIQGYSEKAVNTVEIGANKTVTVGQTPALKLSAIPAEITNTMIHYKVTTGSGTLIDEQTLPVKIYAKDTMIWAAKEGDDWTDTSAFIAAFVTPHAAEINDLVRKAAEYEEGRSMTGYQCGECTPEGWEEYTQEQVKAIYEALQKDYQITYINSSIAYSNESDSPQRVRLPAESLRSGSANCIDGAVLYASALENLGMHPYILITPDHAFVGYETKPDDPSSIRFLETTMTGSASFEDATDKGNDEFRAETSNGNIKSGDSQLHSIKSLRDSGIRPMQ